jgi:hypothetical protein
MGGGIRTTHAGWLVSLSVRSSFEARATATATNSKVKNFKFNRSIFLKNILKVFFEGFTR